MSNIEHIVTLIGRAARKLDNQYPEIAEKEDKMAQYRDLLNVLEILGQNGVWNKGAEELFKDLHKKSWGREADPDELDFYWNTKRAALRKEVALLIMKDGEKTFEELQRELSVRFVAALGDVISSHAVDEDFLGDIFNELLESGEFYEPKPGTIRALQRMSTMR